MAHEHNQCSKRCDKLLRTDLSHARPKATLYSKASNISKFLSYNKNWYNDRVFILSIDVNYIVKHGFDRERVLFVSPF